MLEKPDVLKILKESGAYLEGHFLLTSGLHSPQYIEKFRVLERPERASVLCEELARRFADDEVNVVLGPAVGGIIIAYEVAKQLGARAIFAERESGRLCLRRGFVLGEGDRVLVVEDIATTGGSVGEVIELVKASAADLVGVGLLVDRSGGRLSFGVRTEALVSLEIEAYAPDECPLCRKGIPISQRGSRGLGAQTIVYG
ncbi:MAG: orotate phosphoribosyltransferase [Bacillota bacterium]|nr:orotate phosphoribosyltransferase [Bacillota bacterium]HOB91103.1 orotate phosphoribosyltransferase [Bacillota bacterium]HPZ54229.1 orotate phosphoribosyltransferase [Bacillota bacterium]HQD18707.1 orotate phosphoribosyltransferase [Bacillota bacterium]